MNNTEKAMPAQGGDAAARLHQAVLHLERLTDQTLVTVASWAALQERASGQVIRTNTPAVDAPPVLRPVGRTGWGT